MKVKNKEKQSVRSCKVCMMLLQHMIQKWFCPSLFFLGIFLGGFRPGMGEKGDEQSKNMQLHNHNKNFEISSISP